MRYLQADISPVYSKILLDLLSERGFHPSSILRGTGVELSSIADPESKINLEQQLAIYGNALNVSGVEGLGLLQGQRMTPSNLGVFGYAIQTSANLQQALRSLVSYSPISGALMDFRLQADGEIETLTVTNVAARGSVRRYIVEEHFVTVDRVLKTITGNKFRPARVMFDYPEPPWAALYREIFDCPVDFDSQVLAYQFEAKMMKLDVVNSDPETASACEKTCEEMIAKMSDAGGYIDRIRRVILMLPCRSRNLTSVAKDLKTSPRSLRRKLADENTTFQQLLDEVRLEIALQYLQETRLPLEDIASLLGYSEGASFRHAFKKWTGSSPGSFRSGGSSN